MDKNDLHWSSGEFGYRLSDKTFGVFIAPDSRDIIVTRAFVVVMLIAAAPNCDDDWKKEEAS